VIATAVDPKAFAMPFDQGRRLDEYQGVEDPRPHSVKVHPQEPISGMKPEAARALPPQDD
jgi:hypothetical protein